MHKVAHLQNNEIVFGKGALCSKHGKHKTMIKLINYILMQEGKRIPLKQNFNCSNYAICCTIQIVKLYIYQTNKK